MNPIESVDAEGHNDQVVESKSDAWKTLRGAAADLDFDFAAFREEERKLEDRKVEEHFKGKWLAPGAGGSDK